MESTIPPRYQGRPMLVVLENYVLAVIGTFPQEKFDLMGEVIASAWGPSTTGDWRETVRRRLGLDEAAEEAIKELWERNKDSVTDLEFAQKIADQNYEDLLEA